MDKRSLLLPDLLITLPSIFLLSLGVLVIYSSDTQLALGQLIFALLGLLIYWLLASMDIKFFASYAKYFYIGVVVLLVIVFLLGFETRGSLRWIPLGGMQFQPSEFAKPVLILLLAEFWSKRLASWQNLIKSFLLILPALGLIFKQPDLGTALTILAIWLIMLVGANVSQVKLAVMGLASVVVAPIVWMFLKDYQRARIASFVSPNSDPLGIGYNVIQSTIAVGSGEFLGRGLGRGTQSRLQFLPEFRTDFMFASVAEEFGFVGSMVVMALYGLLIARSFQIVSQVRDRFSSLLVFGALGMLFFQIVVNVGMNIGIVPVTGITLPFLSYGGSSLVSSMICLSFIASAARYGKRQIFAGGYQD